MKKQSENGSIMLIVLIIIIIITSAALAGGVRPKISSKNLIGGPADIVGQQTSNGEKNLQLGSLSFGAVSPTSQPPTQPPTQTPITPGRSTPTMSPSPTQATPTPKPKCNSFDYACINPVKWIKYLQCYPKGGGYLSECSLNEPDNDPTYEREYAKCPPNVLEEMNCVCACIKKPIIYLYPTKKTLVDIRLVIPGKITASDPVYENNGWENITAYPDGTLIYKGKEYKELYYETAVGKIRTPEKGIIIPTKDLEIKLDEIITRLGLIKNEKKEFLDYWIPELNQLESPYILFSIIDPDEKERIDLVEISPKPDTRIEFLAYFKPLKKPIKIDPLILPENPPKRIGFTEVEWGGTISQ